jgi:DtxR family Mn-dependent transcriptional regulator
MKDSHNFGESAEMYLKTVAELSDTEQVVPVTALAQQLSISTVSASEMVHKLQERGLVEHQPYKGVRLTELGARRANEVLRRHRLWECFLVDQLGLSWGKAYEFACKLEHATDEEVVDALYEHLDSPETCPHGNPIPGPDGIMNLEQGISLSHLLPGQEGLILRVQEPSAEILSYLEEKRIKPGDRVCVDSIEPLEGPLTLDIGDQRITLGRNVAQHIIVSIIGKASS